MIVLVIEKKGEEGDLNLTFLQKGGGCPSQDLRRCHPNEVEVKNKLPKAGPIFIWRRSLGDCHQIPQRGAKSDCQIANTEEAAAAASRTEAQR